MLQCSFRFKQGGETVGAAASLRLGDKDSNSISSGMKHILLDHITLFNFIELFQ